MLAARGCVHELHFLIFFLQSKNSLSSLTLNRDKLKKMKHVPCIFNT